MGLNRHVGLDNAIGIAGFERRHEVNVVKYLEDGIMLSRALKKIP